MAGTLPAPGKWNAAVQHSLDNPSHILGPYTDADGNTQVDCVGDGDPYEPNCDFDTAALAAPAADAEAGAPGRTALGAGTQTPEPAAPLTAPLEPGRQCDRDDCGWNAEWATVRPETEATERNGS